MSSPADFIPFLDQPPLIFLDIDGVLNGNTYWGTLKKGEPRTENDQIDPKAVELLNQLCFAFDPDVRVVVSSTWRMNREIDELQAILDSRGFKGTVIGKTDDLRYGDYGYATVRGNEVYKWIKDHPELVGQYYNYDRYVIFDDDSDFLYNQRHHLILTDGWSGLTPKDIFIAKKILGQRLNNLYSPY